MQNDPEFVDGEQNILFVLILESEDYIMKKSEIDIAVLILFFNRPNMLEKVFEQVRKAKPSKLYLYQDGPRLGREDDLKNVQLCRKVVENIDWDCKVHKNYQEKNRGCDPSEYLAQKWMFETEEMGIILEDDDVPSLSFFPFCKELLEKYKDDTRINMICGMNHLEKVEYCPYDYFFSNSGSITGWATWKRIIDSWDPTYAFLDDPYTLSRLRERWDYDKKEFEKYVEKCRRRKNSGVEYYETILSSSAITNSRLFIIPTNNMICNIGNEGESAHGAASFEMLPKGIRRIFNMQTYEVEFPLKHPHYVMADKLYQKRVRRVMGTGHPMVCFYRRVEHLFYEFREGDFSAFNRFIERRKNKKHK